MQENDVLREDNNFICISRAQQSDAEKERIEPLVFINSPITSSKDDIVGFSTQVDTICEAIQSGATMVGLIADYGSGKSSLTGLLCEKVRRSPYCYPNPIIINMWDSLSETVFLSGPNADSDSNTGSGSQAAATHEVSRLTKSFLYQLSKGNSRSSLFSSYINRRLSKNHGNISFSVGSIRFWIFFVIAVLFYGVYLLGANKIADFADVLGEGIMLTRLQQLQVFHPVFLVLAGLSLLIGIANTCVVFSHWKNQNVRDIEMNDVFDLYTRIIKHIKPRCKTKKQIIVVEDLDRIGEKSVIIGFMKELYRFQNSLPAYSGQFVFVVSVKPEDALMSRNNEQESERHVYSKIFDITVPLKPVHYDDYHSVLLQLINSDPKKKERLEKLIGTTIEGTILPEAFNWLIVGENLTVRDLKDRLNRAIMIMASRQEYRTTTAVTFEACTAVTYLECQYPKDYSKLIQDEQGFAKLMTASVAIMDNNEAENAINALKNTFADTFKDQYDEGFKNDLCSMICSEILNYDFRMYFYTYPSGSHVKTTEERRLCDMLLMPARYADFNELDTCVETVYRNGDDNIVTNTLRSLEHYPKVVLMNQTLLNIAGKSDWQKAANVACAYVLKLSENSDLAPNLWNRIHDAEFPAKADFLSQIVKTISDLSQPEEILLHRTRIVDAYKSEIKSIPSYKSLFNNDKNQNIPLISQREIGLMNHAELSILLIDVNPLSSDNFGYIADLICSEKLSGEALNHAKRVMTCYLDFAPEGIEVKTLDFLHINHLVDNKLFDAIYMKCDVKQLVSYLNELSVEEITDQYYRDIDERSVENGLSTGILDELAKRKLYRGILLHTTSSQAYQILDRERENTDSLRETCHWLCKNYRDAFLRIRYHLCVELDDENYLSLFDEDYPIISEPEYASFRDTSVAIRCINLGQVTTDNYMALLTTLRKRTYTSNEGSLLLHHFFDPSCCPNAFLQSRTVLPVIADQLDYSALHIRDLKSEEREAIYTFIRPQFEVLNLTLAQQMQKLNCFVESVEKKLSGSDESQYYALISELDELTPFGIHFLSENYLTIGLSEHLAAILRNHNDNENYIIATALRNNDMILEDNIPVQDYFNVYRGAQEMYEIMSNHWDFLGAIQKPEYLEILYKQENYPELITPLYKVPQHSELFSWILSSQLTAAEKVTYLDAIDKFASEADSFKIQRIICQKENMDLMGDKDRYWRIWHLFWKPEHKSPYTRTWNQRWADQLGHV